MLKNKTFLTVVGFLLAGTGFIALMLSLIGVRLAALAWLYMFGATFAFVTHLLMILVGFVLIYLMQTNFKGEEKP